MGYRKYKLNTLSILCLNVGLALSSVSGAAAQSLEPEPASENPKGYPRICTGAESKFNKADGCTAYTPQHELWSDGAAKDRFIALPNSATEKIDFSDPDRWTFPVGTRLYKNFMEKDKKTLLESRVITKVKEGAGYDSWNFKSYRWNGNDKEPTLVLNIKGPKKEDIFDVTSAHKGIGDLEHDIPGAQDCKDCHALSGKDPVLGFQAIQLKGASPYSLTAVPNVPDDIANGVGITGDKAQVDAIGYLHGNCGSCHAPKKNLLVLRAEIKAGTQPVMKEIGNCYEESFAVDRVEKNDDFAALLTVTAPIEPEKPENSYIYARMSTRADNVRMPKIASKHVDPDGMAKVRNWIKSLTDPTFKRCATATPPVETTEPNEPNEPTEPTDEPFEEGEPTDETTGEEPTDETTDEGEEPSDEESGEEGPFEGDPFGFAANVSPAHSAR